MVKSVFKKNAETSSLLSLTKNWMKLLPSNFVLRAFSTRVETGSATGIAKKQIDGAAKKRLEPPEVFLRFGRA